MKEKVLGFQAPFSVSETLSLDIITKQNGETDFYMRHFVGIVCLLLFFSCSGNTEKPPGKTYAGLSVENSLRQGFQYVDSSGTEYNYRYITVAITNDSIVPIQIKIDFAKEYAYPCLYTDQTFSLFLLPEELTSDIDQFDGDENFETVKKFLDTGIKKPVILNKRLQPKETSVLTVGALADTRYIDPAQIALLSKGHDADFNVHDSILKHMASVSDPLTLSLGINFDSFADTDTLGCYLLVPCGKISYPAP